MSGAKSAYLLLSALVAVVIAASPIAAKPGDADRGEVLYERRCVLCHGEEGDGLGPAAERLNPPPRDFTLGQYKIKTTVFDDISPGDDDLFRMIRDGMPGTAMPGWDDMLSEQDMWDLIAYIETFAGLEEEEPGRPLDFATRIASSPESIARGRELFHEDDRCSECHGADGKGDGVKRLKDDNGDRTWPRNLTKPWAFRASNDPDDVFARISVGIPGTQMPSFADPKSKKKLTAEERWHVANYVNSLAKTEALVRPENIVVKAERIAGPLPASVDDPAWQQAAPTTFLLVPQIIASKRLFTPSNDTITLRALYNGSAIAFLLEWDDRTKSIPGDPKAERIADPGLAEDSVAIQLPARILDSAEKPYFAMGDAAHPVNIWQWRGGTVDEPESVRLLDGRGLQDFDERGAAAAGLEAAGVYRAGTWRVVMKRPLATDEPGKDLQLVEGRFIPIAFAAWDGSNGEKGSRHTMTTWYWLLLKPPSGLRPYVVAFAFLGLIAAGELWWARGAARKSLKEET